MLWSTGSTAHGLQELWLQGSRAQSQKLWRTGLIALQHVGSSQIRDQTHVSCIGRWVLYYWEPCFFFFFNDAFSILEKIFIWLCQVLVATYRVFVAACRLFSCSTWDLVPRAGIEPRPPALGAWSLNHWSTREVPGSGHLFCTILLLSYVPGCQN